MADGATLHSALAAAARESPDRAAIIDGPVVVQYGELIDRVERAAGHLAGLVSPGGSVGLLLPNGADFAIWLFAITRLSAIAAPLGVTLTPRELSAHLRHTRAGALVTNRALLESAVAAGGTDGESAIPIVIAEDPTGPARCTACSPRAGDAALALRSSGSTGEPKLVVRTHRNLMFETERLIAAIDLSPRDRVLGVAPFSHVNGLMRSLVAAAVGGATLVTLRRFDRSAVARAIGEQRITVFIAVPFMFQTLADARWPRPVDFSSLRICLTASAPLKPAVARRFHERYGRPVLQLYGTTETGSIAVNLGGDAGSALESVGRALPGIDVRIVGERGETVPPHTQGEIAIRSPAAAIRYEDRPEASARAFRDGWFFPGDLGFTDEAGRIMLVGRTSLFINRGGFKVNPQEVEAVLEEHALVREAAVTGVETEAGDQRILAHVVLDAPCDQRDLIAFCRERLADYKIPSTIEFRSSLPRTATGKLLRAQLTAARSTDG